MEIRIRYFSSFREKLGVSEEIFRSDESTSIFSVADELRKRGEPWCSLLSEDSTYVTALNHEVIKQDKKLCSGDELAFYPPVTGG